jgi:hypothetical protein
LPVGLLCRGSVRKISLARETKQGAKAQRIAPTGLCDRADYAFAISPHELRACARFALRARLANKAPIANARKTSEGLKIGSADVRLVAGKSREEVDNGA